MLKVRPFQTGDAERASEILNAAFKSFLGEKIDASLRTHFSAEMLQNTATSKNWDHVSASYVAEDEDRVVGVVHVTAGNNGLGSFQYVGVDPECFAKGVGKALMQAAETFWHEKNQRKISTCVSAHNKRALMFYLKHDFIPEGYRRDHFYEGVDEIILGRFL